MHAVPVAELAARVQRFQAAMAAREIAGALIMQNADLYYFTGRIWPAYLFIPSQGEPLFINRHRAAFDPPWPWPAVTLGKPDELPGILADFGLPGFGTLGLELDVLPVLTWQRFQKLMPERKFVDVGRLVRQVRALKSAWEIKTMRSYAAKDLALWAELPGIIAGARTDLEIAAAFESKARLMGEQGSLRMRGFNMEMSIACITAGVAGAAVSSYDVPISGVGLTSYFPFGAAGVTLASGQPITIDYGSCYNSYILDHTRTFAIDYLPDEALRAFDVALAIQEETVALAKPGVNCGELYERARMRAEEAGLIGGFMGAEGGVPFLGHGVGLEVDELPVLARGSRELLEEGMVIAVEPKFALPGIGAVGVENCYLVTAGGLDKITIAPDELVVVARG